MTDHRAKAEEFLEMATDIGDNEAAIALALIGIGHALLAGPADVCQGCGIERPREHDDWCEFGEARRLSRALTEVIKSARGTR